MTEARAKPNTRNVAIVAAHPDDEVLGCGDTAARVAAEGNAVHVLLLADGEGARAGRNAGAAIRERVSARSAAARSAGRILGCASVELLSYADNRMDGEQLLDVVQAVEQFMARHRPSLVLTHHAGDVNVDHRVVHEAVVVACRPQPGQAVRELLFFEVPSSTEWRPPPAQAMFNPNWFVKSRRLWTGSWRRSTPMRASCVSSRTRGRPRRSERWLSGGARAPDSSRPRRSYWAANSFPRSTEAQPAPMSAQPDTEVAKPMAGALPAEPRGRLGLRQLDEGGTSLRAADPGARAAWRSLAAGAPGLVGKQPGPPAEERIGELEVRDITLFRRCIAGENARRRGSRRGRAALHRNKSAHRALLRYCRRRGIPTLLLYHGFVKARPPTTAVAAAAADAGTRQVA